MASAGKFLALDRRPRRRNGARLVTWRAIAPGGAAPPFPKRTTMPSVTKFEDLGPAAMLAFLARVCENKISYRSPGAALRAKHHMTTKAAASVAERAAGCEPYRCQFCGEFHLGHPSRRFVEAGPMTAPVFTSSAMGRDHRMKRLDAYFRDNVMRCENLDACRLSVQRNGHCFSAVQLPHVGAAYDLSFNGRPWRIAVCGQEAGGAKDDASIVARSPRMSKWGRDKSFAQRNPHMRGTTSALRLLFGQPLGGDPWDENIVVDGEYRHLFDAFALINALSCSATAGRTGKNGKSTTVMRRNCVEHLRATVQILQPTVLVVQGNVAQKMLSEAFPDLERMGDEGGLIPSLGTALAMFAHTTARSDWRRGDREHLQWATLDSPYLLDEVAPLLSGLSRHLLQQQRAVAQ